MCDALMCEQANQNIKLEHSAQHEEETDLQTEDCSFISSSNGSQIEWSSWWWWSPSHYCLSKSKNDQDKQSEKRKPQTGADDDDDDDALASVLLNLWKHFLYLPLLTREQTFQNCVQLKTVLNMTHNHRPCDHQQLAKHRDCVRTVID